MFQLWTAVAHRRRSRPGSFWYCRGWVEIDEPKAELGVELVDPDSEVSPLLAFFVGALVCHGQLTARRPASQHATAFYLAIALGGVLAREARAKGLRRNNVYRSLWCRLPACIERCRLEACTTTPQTGKVIPAQALTLNNDPITG